MTQNEKPKGEIIIYKDSSGPTVEVKFTQDTVWLSQSQMAKLFDKDNRTINEHVKNVFKEGELNQNRTIRKFRIVQKEGGREVSRQVEHYNLDVIISVGYRVKSRRGTQFRIWATRRLRDYILKGFAVDKKRLQKGLVAVKELEETKNLFQQVLTSRLITGKEQGLLRVITDYLGTWIILNQYDKGELDTEGVSKKSPRALDYEEAKRSIESLKNRLVRDKQATQIFGQEVGGKLQGVLGNLQQTFGGKPLYKSTEERAAHLLYLVIKDHPFVDGNKRIGSLLFLLYLIENNLYMSRKGERRIDDVALTALALLVAESKPSQKETMVKLMVSLVNKK